MLSPYAAYLTLGAASALFVGMIDPIIAVYYVQVVSLSPLQIVLLGTIVEVAGLLFEVPTGIVADLYSRRLSVIAGILSVGICFVIQGSLPFLAAIALAEVIRGIGATFTSGALEAWIAGEIGEDAAAPAYIRYAQARQAGALVGTVVGVALAGISLALPVLVGGITIVALGLALLVLMPERHFVPAPHAVHGGVRSAVRTFKDGLRVIRGRPVLGSLMVLWLVLAFSTEGVDRLWEAHLLAHFTFPVIGALSSVAWLGAINVVFILLSIAANEVSRRTVRLSDDRAVARALGLVSLVRIGGLVVFGLAASFELAVIGYLTAEVFRRVSAPLFTGWVNRHVDSRIRATLLSMGGEVDAIGQLSGGPAIGLVAQLLSLRAAMVAAGLTLVPALPLLARASRQAAR